MRAPPACSVRAARGVPCAQKKKPAATAGEEDAGAEAPSKEKDEDAGDGGDGDDDAELSLKLKKKKKGGKKKTDEDEDGAAAAAEDADAGDADAGDEDGDGFDLGAKKKVRAPPCRAARHVPALRTPVRRAGAREAWRRAADPARLRAMPRAARRRCAAQKKKKKKKTDDDDEDGEDGMGDDDGADIPLPAGAEDGDDMGVTFEGETPAVAGTHINIGGVERDYKYEELLQRMFQLLHANNPELAGDRKRFVMKPPQVVRDGAKKVVFINFPEICKAMRRTGEHVFNFMLAELGTTGSIDGSNRMVIKGRFQPKAVEHVIRKYVSEYVMCSSCKSPDTDLHKENRLYFMQCNNCGARRSVAAITAGYKAQIGRRIKTG